MEQNMMAPMSNNSGLTIKEEEMNIAVITNLFLNEIPEEEKAVEIDFGSQYKGARDQGFFTPVIGKAKLSGVMKDKIYAEIRVDEKKNRLIHFCQQYDDGTYSPDTVIAQSDLVLASSVQFDANKAPIPNLKKQVYRFIERVFMEYMGKVRAEEVIPVMDILTVLFKSLPNLPIRANYGDTPTPEQFYLQVMEAIKAAFPRADFLSFYTRKSYYTFGELEIGRIADELKMDSRALIKKLAEHEFLYLTPSSQGYQSKIRIDADLTDWAYCVKRLEFYDQTPSNEV